MIICYFSTLPFVVNKDFHLDSPGGSIGLTVWLQFYLQLHILAGGSTPNFPSPRAQGPHLTQRVTRPYTCTCQMTSKSVERFKQGARM